MKGCALPVGSCSRCSDRSKPTGLVGRRHRSPVPSAIRSASGSLPTRCSLTKRRKKGSQGTGGRSPPCPSLGTFRVDPRMTESTRLRGSMSLFNVSTIRGTLVTAGAMLSWCCLTGAAEAPLSAASTSQARVATSDSFASRLDGWEADPSFLEDEELSALWRRMRPTTAVSLLAADAPPTEATDDLAIEDIEPSSPTRDAAGQLRRPVHHSSRVQARAIVLKLAQAARPKTPLRKEAPGYLERVIDQGDAGDLKVRYVHRRCGPSHMIDVCYMPAANRQSIVVQRW